MNPRFFPTFQRKDPHSFDFSTAKLYQKMTPLPKARINIAEEQQEVRTILDGREESRNTAQVGDYIITGVREERYVLTPNEFHRLYRENPDDPSEYLSKNLIRALPLDGPTEIGVPWGVQRVEKGVIAQRVEDENNIYMIEEKAFRQTYAEIPNPVLRRNIE